VTLARAALVVTVAIGTMAVAHACSPFGVNDEAASDGALPDAETPTSGREPPKSADIRDAASYDGPVLEGGSVVDSGFCSAKGGPTMVELSVGGARFCIDSTEVTVAQYKVFLDALDTGEQPDKPTFCAFNTNYAPNCSGAHATDPEQPVNCIDWCDAWAFCKWAGKRLCGKIGGGSNSTSDRNNPSKSQWFAACTRGGARTYAYGNDPVQGKCSELADKPAKVKSHAGCEGGYEGLFDVTGNVGEWEDSCSGATGEADYCRRRGGDIIDVAEDQICAQEFSLPRNSRRVAGGIRCCKD
jgi:formylglycine-generating enzyme